jgi:hypothetical protein
MSRRPANITQADIAHAIRAAATGELAAKSRGISNTPPG